MIILIVSETRISAANYAHACSMCLTTISSNNACNIMFSEYELHETVVANVHYIHGLHGIRHSILSSVICFLMMREPDFCYSTLLCDYRNEA